MMTQLPSDVVSPEVQRRQNTNKDEMIDDTVVAEDSGCSFVSDDSNGNIVSGGPIHVVAKPTTPQPLPLDLTALQKQEVLSPVYSPPGRGTPPPTAIPTMPKDFQVSKKELLGKGTFGCVYRALDRDTNRIFAVKEIPTPAITRSEIDLLGSLSHKNIIKLYGVRQSEGLMEIFMEYVSGGNISSVIKQFGVLTETQARIYTIQILDGLIYLHDKKVIHRDLKGDNILVEVDGTVKLADFGTAREVQGTQGVAKTVTGTTSFMAPEIIKGSGYNTAVDIWSLGCCVLEMLSGKPPFSEFANQYAAMFHIAGLTSTASMIPEGLSAEGMDFLAQCLRVEPTARSSAQTLRDHPWCRKSTK
jgi:serine/threonine protein kinase